LSPSTGLGRSVREVATALHELTTRGVQVRSLREGVDTSTPTGRAVTSIMATIAELELELVRSAVRHLVRLGWHAD